MTADSEEALNWEGDETVPRARPSAREKGRASAPAAPAAAATDAADDAPVLGTAREHPPLSTAMLLIAGVVGGIYLLYSVGWVVGGLRLKPIANFFVTDAMFLPWFILAVAAPALWFLATWVLTRGRATWIRASVLLLGVVLLVPWPFVTVGVIGS